MSTIRRSGLAAPVICGLAALTCSAWAQRADQRPVLESPRPAEAPAPRDVVPDFGALYRRAGAPKIVLFWNRVLSDRSALPTEERKVVRDMRTASANSNDRSTNGPAGNVALKDSESRSDRTRVETKVVSAIAEPGRRIGFEERHAVMVERAFVAEMNRAGVGFVDRALVMRTTAASDHRGGADQQLIETDALLKYADLLMEVVWIEDKDAPSGYAFDVRTKDLRTGQELTSVYSRGLRPRPPPSPGGWTAGKDGYEFVRPPPPPEPSPAEVGGAVSHDVMRSLGGVLATRISSRPRP